MTQNTPCFLTVIGENLHNHFHQTIIKTFPDYDYCSPEKIEDVDTTLKTMVEKSVSSKAMAILIINGHGNNSPEMGLTFPKLKIKAQLIHRILSKSKKENPDFRCFIIMEVCFSGRFATIGDNLCCETLITSTDDSHVSRNNLVIGAFNEVLSKFDVFTPDMIYNHSSKNSDDENWSKQSRIVQSILCWDTSEIYSNFAKKNNLSEKIFNDCIPQKFGNTNLNLKPVVSAFTMTESVLRKVLEKNLPATSENLYNQLLEYTNNSSTFDEFFASMTLRQFKYNNAIKPIDVVIR